MYNVHYGSTNICGAEKVKTYKNTTYYLPMLNQNDMSEDTIEF